MSTKKSFGGCPAIFDFEGISLYVETNFWASEGGAVGLKCLCRFRCVFLRRVYRMSTKIFFVGFAANFDFQVISQYVETHFWAAQGGAVGLQCLCKTWCVLLKTSPQNEQKKKKLEAFQRISIFKSYHSMKRLISGLRRVVQRGCNASEDADACVEDVSTEWAQKKSFDGIAAHFEFQDISQYEETYFLASEGAAVGLQCVCRSPCV